MELELENEYYEGSPTQELDELYVNILEAWNNSAKQEQFLDWAMNFRYDESKAHIMIHYSASEDLSQLFQGEFEDVAALKIGLEELFQARVDNQLDQDLLPVLDMTPPPYVAYCDEQQTALVYELTDAIFSMWWDEFVLEFRGDFLERVLEWLSYDVDVSPVIDSIRGLVDVLDEYESEDLQNERVQSELEGLMDKLDEKNIGNDDDWDCASGIEPAHCADWVYEDELGEIEPEA